MNYEPLHAFAEKHRVSYNELCVAARESADSAPLTEEQIFNLYCASDSIMDATNKNLVAFARAIEAAHGIRAA